MDSINQISFERLQENNIKDAIDVAVKAFLDYEYMSTYVQNEHKRQKFLQALLTTEFKVNSNRSIFFVAKQDDEVVGVAILCKSGYRRPSTWKYLSHGLLKAIFGGGVRDVFKWFDMEVKASNPCITMGNNIWYLNSLTILPEVQGHQIGSKIISDCIIPYVKDNGGDGLCLFTNSEINRVFYTKNGFEEFHEQSFTYKGKTIGSWSYKMKF